MAASMWKSFSCHISELALSKTLVCGQSFRWKETSPGVWTGVMGGLVWNLRQTDDEILYRVFGKACHHCGCAESQTMGRAVCKISRNKVLKKSSQHVTLNPDKINFNKLPACRQKVEIGADIHCSHHGTVTCLGDCISDQRTENEQEFSDSDLVKMLTDYFQLDVNLAELYRKWSGADSHFERLSKHFGGIRILRQDPVETLFSFICSSNNNISRISSMVNNLCLQYGRVIADVEHTKYYSFPRITDLASNGVEEKLRSLGFGYRAKYINKTAKYVVSQYGEHWLHSLRSVPYTEAKTELMKLTGVGAKVADCVCLMSLDKVGAVPVDTHVWQFTAQNYMHKLKQCKSLTDKLYGEIGDFYRDLWGPYAGWAHSVLFAADLKKFKELKTIKADAEPPRKKVRT